ncbi:MAG: PIG-L family deacetylase [Candidatus Omnitrophica bacterium]|nr:PIG-L family deacetylase [Candidatus Omnitrophota bacterium]
MNILAVGAHPDDIEIGCGGTLLKYGFSGHRIFSLVLTRGDVGGDLEVRSREQRDAADFMGAKEIFWGDFKDTELVGSRETILKIEETIDKVSPDMVFLNFPDDVHQDHRAAAQAGISASRYIREVLFYEVPTTQHFDPDIFVDITDVLEKKIELMKKHASQIDRTRVNNLTIIESMQSCANFRGYQGRVKFAEGFKALRVLRSIQ